MSIVAGLLHAADDMGVLFVGGTYSNVDPMQVDKFEAQKRVLDRLGIPWRDVNIKSTRPYTESVPILEEAIEDCGWKHYAIVSHSAGGLTTLSALLERPELQDNLSGWVAYQAPFYGASPVDRATRMLDIFDPLRIRRAFDFTGLHRLSALTTREERLPYMRRHDDEIRRLTAEKPVICVSADAGTGTDGLVDTDSMVLPGAAELSGGRATHLGLTMGGHGSASHQEEIFSRAWGEIAGQFGCEVLDRL